MNKKFLSLGIALVLTGWCYGGNIVTLDNQSGQPALVKLIGPTITNVFVESGTKETVIVVAGRFTMKARYGTEGKYAYSKGDDFEVTETPTAYSQSTITLHRVVNGNYGTHPISEKEFGVDEVASPSTHVSVKKQWKPIVFQSAEIHDVAKAGDIERAKALIASDETVVDARDKVGQTPLHKAAIYGQKEFVKFLLANGADMNAPDRNGYTPLYVAKTSGESDVAGFLEQAGGTDAIQPPIKPSIVDSKVEEELWPKILSENSAAAFSEFHKQYPNSKLLKVITGPFRIETGGNVFNNETIPDVTITKFSDASVTEVLSLSNAVRLGLKDEPRPIAITNATGEIITFPKLTLVELEPGEWNGTLFFVFEKGRYRLAAAKREMLQGDGEWQRVSQEDTVSAYKNHLINNPKTSRVRLLEGMLRAEASIIGEGGVLLAEPTILIWIEGRDDYVVGTTVQQAVKDGILPVENGKVTLDGGMAFLFSDSELLLIDKSTTDSKEKNKYKAMILKIGPRQKVSPAKKYPITNWVMEIPVTSAK